MSDTFRPEHADALRFASTGITAGNRALAAAGAIDVVPAHYGEIDRLYAAGAPDAGVEVWRHFPEVTE